MLPMLLQILAVLTAFLIGPASSAQGTLTVAQTGQVNVHPRTELRLNCGDGTHTGEVQYWHTPFGQLRNHGNRGDLDPAVSMRSDGSLFAANASDRHGGLYYCLLVATGGATLWPYRVNISKHGGPDLQMAARGSSTKPGFGRDRGRSRPRRDLAGSGGEEEEEEEWGVTEDVFAGAVAGSVVLTFVLGFGAGALSRTHVLRCLGVVSSKMQSLRRRRRTGRGPEVAMTTLPDTYIFYEEIDSPRGETTMDTTCSSCTSPPPPTKPQRSFRHKRAREDPEPTAYLEGCDPVEKEVQEVEKRDGQEEKEVEERMKESKEGEPKEKYVEERVEARMKERKEGEPKEKYVDERVEARMKESKEGEPKEKYVEERVEARMDRRESREEERIREGEEDEKVEKRRESRDEEKEMNERRGSREGEGNREGEPEVKEVEERRESREEGNREGEPEEKKVEEEGNREGEPDEEVEEKEMTIEEKRKSQEEQSRGGKESRGSGDQSPTVTLTEVSSEEGGRGENGRKSEGMAEGKEVVVEEQREEQMETASAREERQNKGGVEEKGGEVSSVDDDISNSSSDSDDEKEREKGEDERRSKTNKEGAEEEGGTPQPGITRGRRSRVIRLYQYDDEGHRYSHLPSPAPSELGPTPRLKQRSLSLTRLSIIMATATANPLTSPGGETGGEEECPSPPFSPAPFFKMDL